MLDIGGAHGYFSVALCRRHPTLRSTILDLPDAVEQSQPLLAREGMGDRITYCAGNALTDNFGVEIFDLVFIANLVHHFDDGSNRDLMKRVARALRPGGYCVILEIIRSRSPEEAGQIGALTDFYFAITSASGTWSFEEMADWQRAAGLAVQKPIRLRMSPGYGMQAAKKV
jgi:2-polyprenyl-3-methyl-5-hydroxy-6-metoxy-1,4-benzoquinol methylase